MSTDTLDTLDTTNEEATGTSTETTTQEKTYTQAQFDKHMAGLKRKYERQLADLGDIEELKQLKATSEKQKQEQALKRGEFDKIMQELASKKDADIAKRDEIIKGYKIDTPLISASAKFNAVNVDQVKALLMNQVRLNTEGDVEVVDTSGNIRYSDEGTPMSVDHLVKEFLDTNPHFVRSTPATTNSKTNIAKTTSGKPDLSNLDMKNPEHRKKYAEAKSKGII